MIIYQVCIICIWSLLMREDKKRKIDLFSYSIKIFLYNLNVIFHFNLLKIIWLNMLFCMVHPWACAVLSHSVKSASLWLHGLEPTRLLCSWWFSRQEYWSGLPSPPPGDLPNLGLLHCRWIIYQVSDQESPGILELVVYWGRFATQELNQGLLHWRRILYQLTYPGSPLNT